MSNYHLIFGKHTTDVRPLVHRMEAEASQYQVERELHPCQNSGFWGLWSWSWAFGGAVKNVHGNIGNDKDHACVGFTWDHMTCFLSHNFTTAAIPITFSKLTWLILLSSSSIFFPLLLFRPSEISSKTTRSFQVTKGPKRSKLCRLPLSLRR